MGPLCVHPVLSRPSALPALSEVLGLIDLQAQAHKLIALDCSRVSPFLFLVPFGGHISGRRVFPQDPLGGSGGEGS